MTTFDATAVRIERHRMSVTQGEVSVFYAEELLGRFRDDTTTLCTDKLNHDHGGAECISGWHGHPDRYWIDAAAYEIRTRKPTLQEQIAAKEHELEAAKAAEMANFNRPVGWSKRGAKRHKTRIDAQLKAATRLREIRERIVRELEGLRGKVGQPEPAPLDLARLPFAQFIRTRHGWYKVVRVNAKSVKVVVEPGMDDLVKVSKILEIREHPAPAADVDVWAELAEQAAA